MLIINKQGKERNEEEKNKKKKETHNYSFLKTSLHASLSLSNVNY